MSIEMRMVQVFWVQFEEVANESTFKTSKSKIKFQDFLEIKYLYQVNIASHSFLKKQQKKTVYIRHVPPADRNKTSILKSSCLNTQLTVALKFLLQFTDLVTFYPVSR